MKKWPKRVLLALCAGFAATPAVALQQGDWLLRLGPAWVLPNADSSEVTGLPGSGVDVDNAVTLGFTVGYMVTDNLGIELLGVVPPEHDLEGDGSISWLWVISATPRCCRRPCRCNITSCPMPTSTPSSVSGSITPPSSARVPHRRWRRRWVDPPASSWMTRSASLGRSGWTGMCGIIGTAMPRCGMWT